MQWIYQLSMLSSSSCDIVIHIFFVAELPSYIDIVYEQQTTGMWREVEVDDDNATMKAHILLLSNEQM